MSTLQEQLLKAGLVDKKTAKKVSKEKSKAKKVQHKSKNVAVDETKLAAAKVRAEKVERDRLLNDEQKAKAERKAIAAQIKQLITMNRQAKKHAGKDETTYNFTDGKQIKKMYVSDDVQKLLSNGRLAIVKLEEKNEERYELVPAVIADKISQRDESCVISQQVATQIDDEDDPYADYQIPDDLMW